MRYWPVQFSGPSFPPLAGSVSLADVTGSARLIQTSAGSSVGGLARATHEAVGPGGVGGGQYLPSVLDDRGGAAEVDLFRRQQADAAVPVLGVVPLEEFPAEVLRLLDAAEATREARVVLDGLEVRLRVRVVVRDPGAAQRLRHAQVRPGAAPCTWPSWEIPGPSAA